MALVRLQKFLADCGVGSRRNSEKLITSGKVSVNGKMVHDLGVKVDPDKDQIAVSRKLVRPAHKGMMILNKPRGMVSTLSDPEGRPTVAEFLTKHYQSYFPVGRLDFDSTGLMILTNDGEMADHLMHPRFGFERVYQARVEGSVSESVLGKLSRGVKLHDGVVTSRVTIISTEGNTTWVEVVVKEGKNRVVRRLLERVGHPVIKLKRVSYGPIKLGKLQVGRVRVFTQKEYLDARRKVLNFKSGEGFSEPAVRAERVREDVKKSKSKKKSTVRRRWRGDS